MVVSRSASMGATASRDLGHSRVERTSGWLMFQLPGSQCLHPALFLGQPTGYLGHSTLRRCRYATSFPHWRINSRSSTFGSKQHSTWCKYMRLLGNFPSQLSSSYYADLLALVKQQIAVGEYAGGSTFDAAAVAALQAQGQTFTALAIPSSGDRAIADSVNTPVNLINVRFEAIQSEVTYLQSEIASLAASLANQTSLLDQLLRSEEHTSELQSLRHLVCRLL